MIAYPDSRIRKRATVGIVGIAFGVLLLLGCLVMGCSATQKAAWDGLLNPAAERVQDEAVEAKIEGKTWAWEDLAKAFGAGLVAYATGHVGRKKLGKTFVNPTPAGNGE